MKYYDNEVIYSVALDLGYDIDTIRKAADQKSSGFMYSMVKTSNTLPLFDQVYITQSKVIRHLASQESCIIVNGVADYILEDFSEVISVFIHAPMNSRIKRVKDVYKEDHENIEKYIVSKDKRRSHYYTTKKWGQLKNFDLTINSDLGIEEVADIIVDVFKNSYE
ncbi:MAG: cytidylate kinase-like family protein [Bacilli bacterium]|nr:cytidylate kinase-like family protein [Bacilli bacterium]